jgi:YfiH family protein
MTPMHPISYTHPYLESDDVTHGFFGREGGISEGLYRGLNCGAGSHDNKAHVAQNRALVAGAMGGTLCTMHQVHSPNVVILHEAWAEAPPQADAMATNLPGITLGILTADCAPVLFADHAARVIGAAHAGWKGAVSGVLENTIDAMEKLGATRRAICAVIGPTIAQKSYEVGPEFRERFAPAEQAQFFIPSTRAGHWRFDLAAYVAARLTSTGLQRIAMLGMDTASDPERFFSYRRATLAGEPDYGRQISAIGLK